jgi:isopenicillin-N epimerase
VSGDRSPALPWSLDSAVAFLNHGSFGACPLPVLEAQQALRAQMEREPVRFFLRELPPLLAEARRTLAAFLGAEPEGLAFVRNATTGINSVLRSIPLPAGCDLLVTDHEYNASRNVLEFAARERGCRVAVARVPFPVRGPGAVLEAVLGAVTPATRLALLDHVTSQTALVFPIAELVRELERRGVDVLVDGAHAPGMLPLDLSALSPAYYTGNCHKWLCAPKGAGFLWVREDRREAVRPAVLSHGASAPVPLAARFRAEFDWTGTDDPTPALAVPAALRTLGALLSGGWPVLMASNRSRVLAGRRVVAEALGVPLPCPDEMIGSMASLPLPASLHPSAAPASALALDALQEALFRDHAIEVPVLSCPAFPGRLLRVSAQLYNRSEDYERLARALLGAKATSAR